MPSTAFRPPLPFQTYLRLKQQERLHQETQSRLLADIFQLINDIEHPKGQYHSPLRVGHVGRAFQADEVQRSQNRIKSRETEEQGLGADEGTDEAEGVEGELCGLDLRGDDSRQTDSNVVEGSESESEAETEAETLSGCSEQQQQQHEDSTLAMFKNINSLAATSRASKRQHIDLHRGTLEPVSRIPRPIARYTNR